MKIRINIYLLIRNVSKFTVVHKNFHRYAKTNSNRQITCIKTASIDHAVRCVNRTINNILPIFVGFFLSLFLGQKFDIIICTIPHSTVFFELLHWWHNIWSSRIDFFSCVNFFVWWSLKDCNNSISHWQLIFFNVSKDSSELLLKLYIKDIEDLNA